MPNITITPLGNNITITEESKNITFTDQTTDITFSPQNTVVEFTVPVSPSISVITNGIIYSQSSISVVDAGGDGSLTLNGSVITYTGPSANDVRSHFTAGTGINILNGQISSAITQYTDTLARQSIGALDAGGDGSFTYDNSTGVFTYTGPSAAQVRAHFSAGSGITLSDGQISIDDTIATKTYATNAATTAVANVIDSAPAALDTLNELAAALGDDANFATTITNALANKVDIDEFNALAQNTLAGVNTDGLQEGTTNLYFTTARANVAFDDRLATKSTTDLTEGTNLYFTNQRARDAISVVDNNGDGSITYVNGVITYTGPNDSDYRAAFSAGTGITLVNGQISTTITQYTNTDARQSISVSDTGGDGSLSYDNTSGVITYAGPTATDYRAAFSAGTGITLTDGVVATTITQYTDGDARDSVSAIDNGGDGSFSYNSLTGEFTYTGPSASEVRSHFTAGTGITITDGVVATTITQYTDSDAQDAISVNDTGGDGSLTYLNGVITYTGPSASEVRAHLSAGTGLTYANGQFAVDNTIATKTYADNAATTAVAAVIDAAPATLDTLNELAAALNDDANFATTVSTALGTKLNTADFSSTADTWLGTKSTTNLAEGTNLYYTTARANSDFDTRLATKSTTDLAEGTNLYYTETRATNNFNTNLALKSTTDLAEGTNLYYTQGRFDTAFSNKDAADLTFDNTISGLEATNTEEAINELQQLKVNVSDLTAAVVLYPTTTASGVNGYNLMVDSINATEYNDTAVNVPTGSITGSDQFVAGLTSAAGILNGNPGNIVVTTTGNIRKTSGNDSSWAIFYFTIYHRNAAGTETLMGTSSSTQIVNTDTYSQYTESALLTNPQTFTSTDRLVIKYYATKTGPNNPAFDIQFGGSQPVRTSVPVPINVIPLTQTAAEVPVDTTNFAGLLSAADGNVQHALDTLDDIVLFSGDYDDLTNKPTIPSTTTDITEGTNLYFTQTRARESVSAVDAGGDGSFSYNSLTGEFTYTGPGTTDYRAAFSAGTGITITDGVVATTITQYTDSLARQSISITDTGGDGSLTYDNTLGVITYTGPSASEVRAHFSAGTGITLTDGVIATTITQYTNTDARGAVSAIDNGGDGSFSYNNLTGEFTYTGPSASEVRSHFSAGTGITITNGVVATTITQYTNTDAQGAISVVDNGGDGSLTYNAGVISYTGPSAAEVRSHFSAGTGITLTNGSIAVDSTIATKTYADNAASTAVAAVIDAAPSTLDTLNELAAALGDDANFSTTITTSLGNKLNTADFSSTADTWLGTKSTTNLAEGTNQYFTQSRARNSVSAGTGISYDSGTGVISSTITQYTDTDARAAISVLDNGGDGSLSYANGVITYTGPSAAEVRSHFSAGTGITITNGVVATTITQYTDSNARQAISVVDAGGDGSLAYDNGTGVITFTGPGVSDYRAAFSAGTGITITNGQISSTISDTNTTYAISAETTAGGANLRLTGSDATIDEVKLAEGSNITITRTDANTITISSTAAGGGAGGLEQTFLFMGA